MYLLSAYVSTLEFTATVQDGVLKIHPQLLFFCCVRTNMAALFLTYIEKMTACNFLSAMKILIYYGTAEISLVYSAQLR